MKRKCCVLLVEDDPVLGPMMAQALAHFGHDCVLATSTEAARESLSVSARFDAVLLDLELDGDRSEPMIEELREQGVELPPIVVLSAQPEPQIRQAVRRVRAKTFLQKPVTLDEVESAVRHVTA